MTEGWSVTGNGPFVCPFTDGQVLSGQPPPAGNSLPEERHSLLSLPFGNFMPRLEFDRMSCSTLEKNNFALWFYYSLSDY